MLRYPPMVQYSSRTFLLLGTRRWAIESNALQLPYARIDLFVTLSSQGADSTLKHTEITPTNPYMKYIPENMVQPAG